MPQLAATDGARGDPGTRLVALIRQLSGENAKACIQCGTCSGSCPFSAQMKHTPRMVLEMIRSGMEQEVKCTDTFWYCASCFSCRVRCPKDINIPELMLALRRWKLYKTRERSSSRFYRTFYWVMRMWGRLQEGALITRYALAVNPFMLVGYAPFGWKLFTRGKMNLDPRPHRVSREVRSIMDRADELEGSS